MEDIYEVQLKQVEKFEVEPNPLKRTTSVFDPLNTNLASIQVQLPLSRDGPEQDGKIKFYTPEHLLLASVSSCFFTTFAVVSLNSNLDYIMLEIKSKGIMDDTSGINIMSVVEQDIQLTIPSLMSEKRALRILKLTERRCPMANSVKAEIKNNYTVIKQGS